MRRPAISAVLLALLACLVLQAAPALAAGEYTVEVCTSAVVHGDGVTLLLGNTSATPTYRPCGNPVDGGIRLEAGAKGPTGEKLGAGAEWALTAPAGTRIHTFLAKRVITSWNEAFGWSLKVGATRFDILPQGIAESGEASIDLPVNASQIVGDLECINGHCEGAIGSSTGISLHEVIAHMEDLSPPSVPKLTGGSLLSGVPVGGKENVDFVAEDAGSGVEKAILVIDGQDVATQQESNGGRCHPPFEFLAPCAAKVESSLSFETAKLASGTHTLAVAAVDAGGNRTLSAPVAFTVVHPQQEEEERRKAEAAAKPEEVAPALSGVSLSRKRFRVGKQATALAASAKNGRGTVLRFNSSEAGKLAILVEALGHGKPKRLAVLIREIAAGRGTVALSGRIGHKPMPPGRYQLTLIAADATGEISLPVRVPLTILPG